MSKSFNVNVSFNCRAVLSDEEAAEIEVGMAQLKAVEESQLDGRCRGLLAAYEAEGVEGALKAVIRIQVRQVWREEFLRQLDGGDYCNFSPFKVEITRG